MAWHKYDDGERVIVCTEPMGNGRRVCTVTIDDYCDAVNRGRLIAAAPDMLEALQEVVSAIDGLHPDSGLVRALNRKGSAARQVLLALKVANAAIAKARGKQP